MVLNIGVLFHHQCTKQIEKSPCLQTRKNMPFSLMTIASGYLRGLFFKTGNISEADGIKLRRIVS